VQGRPRKITRDAEDGIIDFLNQKLTAYQDEIADFLLTEYGIQSASIDCFTRAVEAA
jgi:hypothetical protein